MAKFNPITELENISVRLESSTMDDFESAGIDIKELASTQAQFLTATAFDALTAIGAKLGLEKVNCLNIWADKEGGIHARLPYINSDGVNCVVTWGDQTAKLSGLIESVGSVSGGSIVVTAPGKFGDCNGAIMSFKCILKEGAKQEQLIECDSFEELQPLLSVVVPYLNRQHLIDSGVTELTLVDAESKVNKKGDPYWEGIVSSPLGQHRFSFPMDIEFKPGDKFLVTGSGDDAVVSLNGVEIKPPSGSGWITMNKLELGTPYTVTEIQAKTGQYPGFNLVALEIPELITANRQMEKYLNATDIRTINPANPLSFTVRAINKKGDKEIAQLSISHGKQSSLAELLAMGNGTGASTKASTPSAKVEDTTKKAKASAAMTPDQIDF
jgi:hypothetical protein